ncbi:MAG: FAD/NAD(P)-binding protein [bacterium]
MATAEKFVPTTVRIGKIIRETEDTSTFRLFSEEKSLAQAFIFNPGQFCMISVLGEGEAPFCIASSPSSKDFLEVTVRKVGKVTRAIHSLECGDILGFRGPYGNGFPVQRLLGRDILVVAGGIGLAALRSTIWDMLENRQGFGSITILYGARTPNEMIYRYDLEEWGKRKDIDLVLTVDPGCQDESWRCEIGLVPDVMEKLNPSPRSVLLTCGPPVMVKFVLLVSRRLGFNPADVYTSLEMKMKCGVGVCGRCNIGSKMVCRDGPVFSLSDLISLPQEF